MKKLLLTFTALFSLIAFSSCTKEEGGNGDAITVYINASTIETDNPADPNNPIETDYWRYYSFSQNKVLGQCNEKDATAIATWAARSDWDIAISKYKIKTNSGTSTTSGGQGGVYTANEGVSFNSITTIPAGATFVVDTEITSAGHGGTTTVSKSLAQVVFLKQKPDGSGSIMPPVYLKSPVYIFKTVDGNKYYKVNFTQYQDVNEIAGHIKFDTEKI